MVGHGLLGPGAMLEISGAYAPIDSKPILNSDLRPVERARTGQTRVPLVVKEVNHEGEDWNIHVIAIPAGSPKVFDAYKNSVVYLNSRPSTGESMGSQITLLRGTRKLAMSTAGGHNGSPTSQLTLTAYDIDSTVTIRCDRSEQ